MSRRALILSLVAITGCWELLPASRDPVRDALHREPKVCPVTPSSYPPELLSPQSIVSVTPLYFSHSERGNFQAHLLGATLALRPLPGVSTQDLERLLACHAARSQLLRPGEPVVPNDPYWVPGHVVRISVELDDGATTVQIEARELEGAKAILERAQAFVQPGAGQAPSPPLQ